MRGILLVLVATVDLGPCDGPCKISWQRIHNPYYRFWAITFVTWRRLKLTEQNAESNSGFAEGL